MFARNNKILESFFFLLFFFVFSEWKNFFFYLKTGKKLTKTTKKIDQIKSSVLSIYKLNEECMIAFFELK